MFKQKMYIKKLRDYIGTFITCYYDEASKSGSFPYCVLIPPSTSELNDGYLLMFDIEIYANELTGAEKIEELNDLLKNNLDNYLLNSENNFNSQIFFENSGPVKDLEQDLLVRRMTFSARVFYL